jgi:rubrerythrin
MSRTVDDLISTCFDQLQAIQHYQSYVKKSADEGYPQISKLFQAVVASETARENLFRKGIAEHAADTYDYYVCPHCGLVFAKEAPEKCPVDETEGAQFEKIG